MLNSVPQRSAVLSVLRGRLAKLNGCASVSHGKNSLQEEAIPISYCTVQLYIFSKHSGSSQRSMFHVPILCMNHIALKICKFSALGLQSFFALKVRLNEKYSGLLLDSLKEGWPATLQSAENKATSGTDGRMSLPNVDSAVGSAAWTRIAKKTNKEHKRFIQL